MGGLACELGSALQSPLVLGEGNFHHVVQVLLGLKEQEIEQGKAILAASSSVASHQPVELCPHDGNLYPPVVHWAFDFLPHEPIILHQEGLCYSIARVIPLEVGLSVGELVLIGSLCGHGTFSKTGSKCQLEAILLGNLETGTTCPTMNVKFRPANLLHRVLILRNDIGIRQGPVRQGAHETIRGT